MPLPEVALHEGLGGEAMKDMTLWGWWYGMLVTLPLFVAGLFLKDRMASAVPQWVRSHRR